MRAFALLMTSAVALAGSSGQNESDAPRRHVESATASRHEFRVRMEGSQDGVNARDPVFSRAWKKAFEPMRAVRLENMGDADIVNPWVIVNGKRNWRSAADIVNEAFRMYGDPARMSDAEKARAIYELFRLNRFHATTGDFEVRDPVKLLNVYGFALCGDNAQALADLWRAAGFNTRRGFPSGHCVSEVWYGGGWHMMDADESGVFLDRDNSTIAGDRAIARDHDLIKRGSADETDAALWGYDGSRRGDYPSHSGHTMGLRLRPGEALEWRWDHAGKHHQAEWPTFSFRSVQLREHWGDDAWALLSNGKWIYAPVLTSKAARRGVTATNVRWAENASGPAVTPSKVGAAASLVWKIETPYVIVGGKIQARLRCKAGSACTLLISPDGKDWKSVFEAKEGFQGEVGIALDEFFPNVGAPVYGYYLRADLLARSAVSDAGLDSIRIENDLQMAPLSLPALELGENVITYSDETNEPHSARMTFDWVERSSPRPPTAPAAPVFPSDGAEVEATPFNFRWQDAGVPGSGRIAEYHFQLSNDPGLRWALSSGFDRLVSTADTPGTASYRLAGPGLLNPGERYYWRVRARSDSGLWSPWSKVWNFVPQGPGVPLNVRLERSEEDRFALAWDANPKGRPPAGFLVYASDEKGFSVSDAPYRVAVGNQKDKGLFPGQRTVTFPANLLAKAAKPRLALEPTHAFYRVVAMDEKGTRSGPSDYIAAPRPFIYSTPVQEVRAGQPYRYEVKTIRSIGDLTSRDLPPAEHYQSAFWDADEPRFSLVTELSRCGSSDAGWLKFDPRTGVLGGTPGAEDAGEYQINIKIEIDGAGRDLQSFSLKVTK